jgi:CMP-N,N'-diacetyllegionaminic acid synthase
MTSEIKLLIPARRNSKGLPFKNRLLFEHTISTIPTEYFKNLLVSTDDEVLIEKCKSLGLNVSVRPDNLALDETSTKEVIQYHIDNNDISLDDTVIMLYLTYPERTWSDIQDAYIFFTENEAKSLLCKKDIKSTHPYLYMFELDNNKGSQLVKHNLYRRQDYPPVFEISHYVCIFNVNEFTKLNNNLYNDDTFFFKIDDVVDVDTKVDLDGVFRKKG